MSSLQSITAVCALHLGLPQIWPKPVHYYFWIHVHPEHVWAKQQLTTIRLHKTSEGVSFKAICVSFIVYIILHYFTLFIVQFLVGKEIQNISDRALNPLAATSVATRMGFAPDLKADKASQRAQRAQQDVWGRMHTYDDLCTWWFGWHCDYCGWSAELVPCRNSSETVDWPFCNIWNTDTIALCMDVAGWCQNKTLFSQWHTQITAGVDQR